MSNGKAVKTNEMTVARLKDGTIDGDAVDGIGAVEDNEALPVFGRRLHSESHRGDIGVKTCTNVLNVENQRVHM